MGLNQIDVPTPGGFYGYTGDNGTVSTPNLAKFASEGMVFQTWYSSFHVCSPSRASMMTGRYSVRSGIGIPNSQYAPHAPGYAGGNLVFTAESVGGLPLNETTLAEQLKRTMLANVVAKSCLGTKKSSFLRAARSRSIAVAMFRRFKSISGFSAKSANP